MTFKLIRNVNVNNVLPWAAASNFSAQRSRTLQSVTHVLRLKRAFVDTVLNFTVPSENVNFSSLYEATTFLTKSGYLAILL
jgi:hypothetical protein